MQSKRASLFESLFNTLSGFLLSLIVGYFLYPLFGMPQSLNSSFWITIIFTVISIMRNYGSRRLFNYLHVKGESVWLASMSLWYALSNRLRGTWSWFRPIYALSIALFVLIYIKDWYAFSIAFALAWVGVAMGWGDWDCVATNRNAVKPVRYTEGDYNGIQWLAEKLISSDAHWLNHCRVCLVLVGAYRAAFLLPLIYWCGWSAVGAFLFLTPMFLLASELGYYTTKLWNFRFMSSGWEHQEIWYGVGLAIALKILSLGV